MRDNAAWMPKDIVTVIDVLEYGACYVGVRDYIEASRTIAGAPVDAEGTENGLAIVGLCDGNGNGNGYGDGDGNGDGYGDGNG